MTETPSSPGTTTPAASYTPELADLMDYEKVIEQGLETFREVGWALLQIRDGKKYRAAGHKTFEHYCASRWQINRRQAHRLMDAASVVAELEMCPIGHILPERESHVRPLTQLPAGDRASAWQEAVETAEAEGRSGPTAKHVEAAVEKRKPPKKDHPAPFSDPIIDTLASRLDGSELVLDPFAGTGRIHELAEREGIGRTVGIEIEPEWAAKHPDTIEGNALDLPWEDGEIDAIATSPTYGNRMADHHDAKDDSVRLTYTHTLGRPLDPDNSGSLQWGDEYRDFHLRAWNEAVRVLSPGGPFVVNVKDHIRAGEKQEVVAWHIDTLCRRLGLELVALDVIPTKGLMAGENHGLRSPAEIIVTFRKSDA